VQSYPHFDLEIYANSEDNILFPDWIMDEGESNFVPLIAENSPILFILKMVVEGVKFYPLYLVVELSPYRIYCGYERRENFNPIIPTKNVGIKRGYLNE